MNALVSETTVEPLLFSWEPPRRRQLALAVFLALSLVAHALCFYVFQIVYPPIVSLLPPPARISVITSSSEEGRTLLRWINAEDPALAFTTQRPPEARLRALPEVEHVPSYLEVEPALKEIPSEVSNGRHPRFSAAGGRTVRPSTNRACHRCDNNLCLIFKGAGVFRRSHFAESKFCRIQR